MRHLVFGLSLLFFAFPAFSQGVTNISLAPTSVYGGGNTVVTATITTASPMSVSVGIGGLPFDCNGDNMYNATTCLNNGTTTHIVHFNVSYPVASPYQLSVSASSPDNSYPWGLYQFDCAAPSSHL